VKVHTVILAAGEGSRMQSNKAKSLQPVGGLSMLRRIFDTVSNLTDETSFVVGFEKDSVINEIEKFSGINHICEQKKPIGTADAVKSALDSIKQNSKVLVLYGDVPLIKNETLNNLISMTDDSLSILSTELKNPTGYGRVKKNENGLVISIVEEKDASEEDKKIKEIFTGILCCNKKLLEEAIGEVNNDNAASEYYLTDIVSIINTKGFRINTCIVPNDEVKGANTKEELSELEGIYREMKAKDLLKMGMNRAIVVYGSGGLDEASLQGDNKLVFVENGKLRFSKINISDFSHENISNEKLVVSDIDSNEEILKSVLNGSGQNPHKYVVALNTALVLWTAGIEDDLHEGFNKALFSINQGNPWEKFLLLRTYLASDE